MKEQVNELVTYQEDGGSIPEMPKIKSFIALEGTLSQEEFINQIKEMKRQRSYDFPEMPKIKSFIALEGTLSQEEFIKQIKEKKRLSELKAEKEKS
ncbi:hypothetical protein Tco_0950202 [Tanacetum coccineum]